MEFIGRWLTNNMLWVWTMGKRVPFCAANGMVTMVHILGKWSRNGGHPIYDYPCQWTIYNYPRHDKYLYYTILDKYLYYTILYSTLLYYTILYYTIHYKEWPTSDSLLRKWWKCSDLSLLDERWEPLRPDGLLNKPWRRVCWNQQSLPHLLVAGWPTLLKNMFESVGISRNPIFAKTKHVPKNQSANQLFPLRKESNLLKTS